MTGVYGGFQLICRGNAVVAFGGAEAPIELVTAGGVRCEVGGHEPIALSDGDTLALGQPRAGIRSYLAVRGGFAVTPARQLRNRHVVSHRPATDRCRATCWQSGP